MTRRSINLPGGRVRAVGEVYGNRPASTAPELHGDGTWPGDDQAGSAGPPPGFEPDDPEGIPDPVFPPTDPAYIDPVSEGPPEGFPEPPEHFEPSPGDEAPGAPTELPPPPEPPEGNGNDVLNGDPEQQIDGDPLV